MRTRREHGAHAENVCGFRKSDAGWSEGGATHMRAQWITRQREGQTAQQRRGIDDRGRACHAKAVHRTSRHGRAATVDGLLGVQFVMRATVHVVHGGRHVRHVCGLRSSPSRSASRSRQHGYRQREQKDQNGTTEVHSRGCLLVQNSRFPGRMVK